MPLHAIILPPKHFYAIVGASAGIPEHLAGLLTEFLDQWKLHMQIRPEQFM